MPVRAALGAVIKARRIELGWTQEELAEQISADGEYVRQSEISRIENGKIALPRRERLERLAQVLELPMGELLARSGWAGAESHFGPPATEIDTSRPADSSPNGSSESQPATDAPSDVVRPDRPPLVASARARTIAYDPNAMAGLRQALARMCAESDRLQHNRSIASAMQNQLGMVTDNGHQRRAEPDYSRNGE